MRHVSGKHMVKVLKSRGWVHVRTNGSHFHYEHTDFPGVIPVPVHGNRDLKPGTQKDIMRQAGLTHADL